MFKQSPLLAVSSISIAKSLKTSKSLIGLPRVSSPIDSSNTKIPSFIFGNPISVEEQIIPLLSSPLNFAFFITKPSPKSVPIVATGTN